MVNNEIKKDRKKHFDRITLDAKTLELVDAWISQVKAFKSGVDLSRKDLLNWLVQSLPERLSGSQEKEIAMKHYNELRFLQYASRRIREAQARGEQLTLKDLDGPSPSREIGILKKKPRIKNAPDKQNTLDITNEISTPTTKISTLSE